MEHVHSILIIKKGNKYLNYYDDRWNMLLFPNIKGNDIEDIKNYIKDKFGIETSNIKLLFDKVHDKYSIPNKEVRTYHHYFYEVDANIDGEYFTLDELLNNEKVKENNSDIIGFIKEYYGI
jgi:hypothetical protein